MSSPTEEGAGARPDLVHELLDRAAARTPEAVAVRDPQGPWSYTRVAGLSRAFAHRLAALGVGRGDRILLLTPSRREIVPALYGASRVGAVVVPLDPGLKEYQLRSIVTDAEPALAIGDGEALRAAAAGTGVPVHGLDALWETVEEAADEELPPLPGPDPDDLALMIYTSGSTSTPKGVMCPHAAVTFAATAINGVLGYGPADVVLCRLPLSFDYGLYQVLLATLGHSELLLTGAESDLLLMKRVREHGVTILPVVPSLATMITTLARRDPEAAGGVRMFTNTGAALPISTIEDLRAGFPGARVVRMYGITECKRVTVMPPEEEHERPGSVGRPLPGTRVLILDPDGRPLPPGESGEITVVGPNVMAGYWRSPEQTGRVYRRDGAGGEVRMRTGDHGFLDADGYLYFEGRRDDMFKRKGVRMSTVEIEAAALDIPGVRAAAVLPPTENRDLALVAESDLAPREVLRELALRLEAAKVPALCRVIGEMPLTRNGKNARDVLTRMFDGPEGERP
ncbi:amino acid adenylation domain-containing protein [Marinactinospora thermotolerans DSM 45154]|uniref:Amino acid adenylation domain-containing protein n=2 Tax=Marinactinospora thermotolerans TaxID=531310 RepID=A0A1T4TI48_9ACTN|nr:amino acid adenylation domain-containing protein [Marinactinospora thermotolerans DSM 45154]